MFHADPSTVKVSSIPKTCLPYISRLPNVS
nr:MAG TPA: hypothetical protein [Caudoviricetes sp.]